MPSQNRQPSSFPALFPRMQVHLPGMDVMTGLALVLVLIHLFLERAGGPSEAPWYYLNFGLSWDGFSHGKIWQLASYGFLHGDWFHLLVNILMLWLIGGRVIHILGHRWCFKIIVIGMLAGGVVHLLTGLLMLRTGYHESQLIGISGACLALLLTLTTLSPDSRMWPVPISGKTLGLGIMLAELLLWLMQPGLGLPFFSSMGEMIIAWSGGDDSIFRISHGCHLGGALAGWLLARRLLAPTPSLESLRQMRDKREKDRKLEDHG
ncbi:MAG: rhomboid family intramembrane serine protease [Akkermansiaceae bacterium]|nr:rhomboid family intramembrane serine protease [Akkermansiaceae bacterium]